MGELIWFLAPVSAILWAAGGTWNKLFRRIGCPAIITVLAFFHYGFAWQPFALAAATFAVTTLPVTLKGDSVVSSWVNRIWVFVWGVLLLAPALIVKFDFLPLAGLMLGLLVTFSNSDLRDFFPWKWCEVITGAMFLYPYCLHFS